MKRKILCLVIILVLTILNFTQTFAKNKESELQITADSAILIDSKTGDILYEKEINKKQYPASITKLMTVLLVLENYNPNEVITFSKNAVFGIERNSSHIAADVDEQLTMEQCLYAIMLNSANEVSMAVAENIAGSVENFSRLMNEKAKELGCKNTNFTNPHGLHDENHYTTAYDMALIAKELIKNEHIKEIMKTTYYEIPPTNKQPEMRHLYAQHKMIKKNSSFYYPECEGGKSGFTNQALNTLVSFAKKGDMELICIVLKDSGTNIYKDTTTLFDYGFKNFETAKICSANDISYKVPVKEKLNNDMYDRGQSILKIENDIYKTMPIGTDSSKIKVISEYKNPLYTPIIEGQKIGSVKFMLDGNLISETPLKAANTIDAFSEAELTEIKNSKNSIFIKKMGTSAVIAVAAITIIILIINEIKYKIREKKRKRKRMLRKKRNEYNFK